MAETTEDPLARTATAPGSAGSTRPSTPSLALGETLGRYKLERELGSGGMGVVYAALDTDLERRIALKVLHNAADAEARGRLLREARAMARLSHSNVVVVHEVGSAGGRDFVAMELIDGETLADWLRAASRSADDIVDAFVAAGRGLAAAHAAGLVHRDFKPHNVLRARDGRIVVTDFGLARGVDVVAAEPASARAASSSAALTGLTVTGSVLGTPAYMAPEQWRGGSVGPATDQFAFCVAVWEALSGARPFRGNTLDDLREQVLRGPAALDASRLPRALRAPLRRGLDPDPRRRWPSMSALLARIDPHARGDRRAVVAFGAAAGAVIAVGVALVASRRGAEPPVCDTKVDIAAVWPAGAAASLARAGQRPAADALDADATRWIGARDRACAVAEPDLRAARLTCLDGVLARFDAVARGVAQLHDTLQHADPGDLLVDPAVCEGARMPRLAVTSSPAVRDAVAAWLRAQATAQPPSRDSVVDLIRRTADDPCATEIAQLLALSAQGSVGDRHVHMDAAAQAAARCTDDRGFADVQLADAEQALGGQWLGDELVHRLGLADTAVQAVAQPDLAATLETLRMHVAARNESLDAAISRGEAAAAGYAARGRTQRELDVELYVRRLERQRGRAVDLAAMTAKLRDMRALAVARLGADDDVVRRIDSELGQSQFWSGDVAGGHRLLVAAMRPRPNDRAMQISGRVVDVTGAPVAGATVYAGAELEGDAIAAALPDDHLRSATTGSDGRFAIADAAHDAVAVAELGDRRAWAVAGGDDVTLVLEPTSRIEGRVELNGLPAQTVFVDAEDATASPLAEYTVIAPVAADGSFAIEGVPRRRLRISARMLRARGAGRSVSYGTTVAVDAPVVGGVALAMDQSHRAVSVIVRSTVNTPLVNAQVIVVPGILQSMSALAIDRTIQSGLSLLAQKPSAERAPAAVLQLVRDGDLYATVSGVPEGSASACAVSLPLQLADDDLWRKVQTHLDKIEVRCEPLAPDAVAVVVEVPPWPRLD
jgi:predicted Ser/Thr protein kinase